MPAPAPEDRHGSQRRDPIALLVVAALLLIARVALGVIEARNGPPAAQPAAGPGPAATRMHWRTFSDGIAEAKATGRPVLYDFTAAWCAPCRVMELELFDDPASAAALEQRFVPVRVLDRQREDGHNVAWVDSLQAVYRVQAFPTLVVTEPGGPGQSRRTQGFMGATATLFALGATGPGPAAPAPGNTPGR